MDTVFFNHFKELMVGSGAAATLISRLAGSTLLLFFLTRLSNLRSNIPPQNGESKSAEIDPTCPERLAT
jgi:hypothetical protein